MGPAIPVSAQMMLASALMTATLTTPRSCRKRSPESWINDERDGL